MKASKESRSDAGSCNFCSRGKIAPNRSKLVYPYEEVYTIEDGSRNGLKASICVDCANSFAEYILFDQIK